MQVGDAYLIVYSITDRASFEKASELRIQLRRARQTEDIPIILVGNKSDLVRCREVSVSGERVCNSGHRPCTAYTGPQWGSLSLFQGLSGMLHEGLCLRLQWFPSVLLVISCSLHPLVYLKGSRLPTALWVFSWSYFREESILRNLLAVLTFAS